MEKGQNLMDTNAIAGSVFAAMAVKDTSDAGDAEAATREEPPAQATPTLAQAGYGEAAGIVGTAGLDDAKNALDLFAGQGI